MASCVSLKSIENNYRQATNCRYNEQIISAPGRQDAQQKGCCTGPGRVGRLDDGRESHDRQGDVGDIVQEAAYEAIRDAATYQQDGQQTDHIGRDGRESQIPDEFRCCHCQCLVVGWDG